MITVVYGGVSVALLLPVSLLFMDNSASVGHYEAE